jgi:endo-1,4-beta-xylanase
MNETTGASASGLRCRTRLLFSAACAAVLVITGSMLATSARAGDPIPHPVITTNQTGTHDGYFYAFWQDAGDASLTLGPGGRYSSQWGEVNNWFGGKGWETAERRTFNYCGTFYPGGNSYLALFGFTRDPLIEFYIVENWGTYRPTGMPMGTFVSEGSTYDIYRAQRGIGITPYYQYFSVRQHKRSGGTINTGDHFDAWADVGMNLGATMGYMIMATEGYQSSGWSHITVDSAGTKPPRCGSGPPTAP